MSHNERVATLEKHSTITLSRQAALLGISRSSIYYTPVEKEADKEHMDMIDEIYTDYPFYGSRRIQNELKDRFGESLCRERIQRLMRRMGIEAIYPKKGKNTSISNTEHQKYPYLLTDITASYPNHIWGTDITYVKTETGFVYLMALLDWFSRYVVSWELSGTLETDFCVNALEQGLSSALPVIHNSDQGVQFTDKRYITVLENKSIQISMDGRGRCMDNIFTERLWRSVKRENVYLRSYRNLSEARNGLNDYFVFYNKKRRHQSLEYRTPFEVYFGN